MKEVTLVFLMLYLTTVSYPLRAEEDNYSFRDAGFTGETSCSDFYGYINEHPNTGFSTKAKNAEFVLMLIITSQKNSNSIHTHGDQMTPSRVHNYEKAFANNCRRNIKMTISSAMKNAVQQVDNNDPI